MAFLLLATILLHGETTLKPQELLYKLENMGCLLYVDRHRLFVRAHRNIMTNELLREIRASRTEIMGFLIEKSYWARLAATSADSDAAWNSDDGLFLAICKALREAGSAKRRRARWRGMRGWLSAELSEAAVLALADLVKENRF